MDRFSNFSQKSSLQNTDDDEEEGEEEVEREEGNHTWSSNEATIIDVDMPEQSEETEGMTNFAGNIFWSRKPEIDEELDLSDFE